MRAPRFRSSLLTIVGLTYLFVLATCSGLPPLESGKVQDEAMRGGWIADSLPAANHDYFHDMDRAANAAGVLTNVALPPSVAAACA